MNIPPILFLSVGSLLYIGLLLTLFKRLKRLYKAKQEPFVVVLVLVIFLMELGVLSLFLTALFKAVLGAAGAKNLLSPRLFAGELAYLRGCLFLLLCLGFYLFALRFPTAAINRRRQRKKLAQLGWQVLKPKDALAVADFKHLVIIGICLWKFEDLRGIETLQRYFQHDDWMVQIFFLDDIDRLADIRTFSPDVKSVWPTPIVSEYQDGVLMRLLFGKDALTWMKQA